MDPGSHLISTAQSSSLRQMRQIGSFQSLPPPMVPPMEFIRSFQKLNKFGSVNQRALRLEHLKRVQIKSVEEESFNKVIRHLEDIATLPKFMREYVDLEPLKAVSGFLEANEFQYFVIRPSGCQSPMHLDIHKEKGSVVSYFSYKSMRPGPDIHDIQFKSRYFKIDSKFTYFKEATAYLCTVALTETYITVTVSYGRQMPVSRDEQERYLVPRNSQLFTFDDEEEEHFPSINKSQVVFLTEHIPQVSKHSSEVLSQSYNFIEANKRVHPPTRSHLNALYNQRHLLAQARRAVLEAEAQDRISEFVERESRQRQALAHSKFISDVLGRKSRFEKIWMMLIAFAKHSNMLYARFSTCRLAIINTRMRSFACYRLQRMYRGMHQKDFDVQSRMLALASNHLKLIHSVANFNVFPGIRAAVVGFIQESCSNHKINFATRRLYRSVGMIQDFWKQKRNLENFLAAHLASEWDLILQHEEEIRRKKTKKKGRRFIHIGEQEKTKQILRFVAEAKEKLFQAVRDGTRATHHLVSYLPKQKELRLAIKQIAKDLRKA